MQNLKGVPGHSKYRADVEPYTPVTSEELNITRAYLKCDRALVRIADAHALHEPQELLGVHLAVAVAVRLSYETVHLSRRQESQGQQRNRAQQQSRYIEVPRSFGSLFFISTPC